MTQKRLLALMALVLIAFAPGCSTKECKSNSDCSGALPVCDTTNNVCVGCSSSTDCSGTTPACDTTNQVCVGCLSSSDCSGTTPACDTTNNVCVSCLGNSDCSGDTPFCDTSNNTCTATCSSSTECAAVDASKPVCDSSSSTCVECAERGDCSGDTPFCDTSSNTCTASCSSSAECAAVDSSKPQCDSSTNLCVECLTASDCGDSTPSCDTNTETCVASCTDAGGCAINQECNTGASEGSFCEDVDVSAASTAIDAIRTAATNGEISSTQTVTNAIVTYLKPSVSGDAAGFTVQAEQSGPALFVAVDPATVGDGLNVGDRITFTADTLSYSGHLPQVAAISNFSLVSSGHDVSALRADMSNIDPTAIITTDDSRLISLTFDMAEDPSNANTGYKKARITTAGFTTADVSYAFYAPATVFANDDLANGCNVTLTNGLLWRYGNSSYEDTEPATWQDSELTVNSCPAPTVVSAASTDLHTVLVSFDRHIASDTLTTGAFTIAETDTPANTLTVSAVSAVDDNTVQLTTSDAQSPGVSYTVTVADSVEDSLGTGVGTPNTTTFTGFVTPAQVVINELNANISSGCDLIELRVMSGGSMEGYRLQERDHTTGDGLATFPVKFMVATNDLIVVHMNNGSSTCNPDLATTETSAKDQFLAANFAGNYDTAWDYWSTDSGLTATDNVFTLYDATGTIMDAVFASDDTSGTAASGSESQAAIVATASQWQMVDGGVPTGGFVDDDFNAWAAQDLNGTGTDALGDTIQRHSDTDSNDKSDWVQTTQSWGALNSGETSQ